MGDLAQRVLLVRIDAHEGNAPRLILGRQFRQPRTIQFAQRALDAEKRHYHRLAVGQLLQRVPKIIDEIALLEFSEIDLPGAAAELALSEERLAALLDPNSDASQAKALYDAENRTLESGLTRILGNLR